MAGPTSPLWRPVTSWAVRYRTAATKAVPRANTRTQEQPPHRFVAGADAIAIEKAEEARGAQLAKERKDSVGGSTPRWPP